MTTYFQLPTNHDKTQAQPDPSIEEARLARLGEHACHGRRPLLRVEGDGALAALQDRGEEALHALAPLGGQGGDL